jgi:hypothetical protein
LRYVPNEDHILSTEVEKTSVLSHYLAVLNGVPIPEYSWTIQQDGKITVQTNDHPTQVLLWQVTNPISRHLLSGTLDPWTPTPLADLGGGTYVGDVPMPPSGATGYFVELTFDHPIGGVPDFVFTSQVHIKSEERYHPWPGHFNPPVAPLSVLPATALVPAPISDRPSNSAARTAAAVRLTIAGGEGEQLEEFTPTGTLFPPSASGTAAPATQPVALLCANDVAWAEIADADAMDLLLPSAVLESPWDDDSEPGDELESALAALAP